MNLQTVITTLHFLRNLQIADKLQFYITPGLKCLPQTSTLAYWAHLKVTKK
jgi:hypothetical protein